ncbi:MAG: hypothetical protein JW919_04050 [Candidatus Omnitrophica bacterium]|nr:hypothetical protein [Candidatus Omnitrophota bacterium]
MKEYRYKWAIGDKEFSGTYHCDDEAGLRGHIAKCGGRLIEILSAEEKASEAHPGVAASAKPAATKAVNVCPRCLTEYDESFKVCFKCDFLPLERKELSASEKYWDEFRKAPAGEHKVKKAHIALAISVFAIAVAVGAGIIVRELTKPVDWKRYRLGWSGFSMESPAAMKKVAAAAGEGLSPSLRDMELYKMEGAGDLAMIYSFFYYREGITATPEREGRSAIAAMQKSFEGQGCAEFAYSETPAERSGMEGLLFSGSFRDPVKLKEEFRCLILVDGGSKLWFLFIVHRGPRGEQMAKRVLDSIKIEALKPPEK